MIMMAGEKFNFSLLNLADTLFNQDFVNGVEALVGVALQVSRTTLIPIGIFVSALYLMYKISIASSHHINLVKEFMRVFWLIFWLLGYELLIPIIGGTIGQIALKYQGTAAQTHNQSASTSGVMQQYSVLISLLVFPQISDDSVEGWGVNAKELELKKKASTLQKDIQSIQSQYTSNTSDGYNTRGNDSFEKMVTGQDSNLNTKVSELKKIQEQLAAFPTFISAYDVWVKSGNLAPLYSVVIGRVRQIMRTSTLSCILMSGNIFSLFVALVMFVFVVVTNCMYVYCIFLQAILYVVGPIAIGLSFTEFCKKSFERWMGSFIATSFWVVTMAIMLKIIQSITSVSMAPAMAKISQGMGFSELLLLLIASIISIALVVSAPKFTNLYVNYSGIGDELAGAVGQVVNTWTMRLTAMGAGGVMTMSQPVMKTASVAAVSGGGQILGTTVGFLGAKIGSERIVSLGNSVADMGVLHQRNFVRGLMGLKPTYEKSDGYFGQSGTVNNIGSRRRLLEDILRKNQEKNG